MTATMRPRRWRQQISAVLLAVLLTGAPAFGAGHRDAPLAERDAQADIADVFAFRSYGGSPTPRVTLIMTLDARVDPGSGANHGLFDPEILYAIKIDNNNDAIEDVVFQVRFRTEIRDADEPIARLGAGDGFGAPANSPPPVAPGTPIVPPRIEALDGPGSEGLSLRQSYTVTMIKGGVATDITAGLPRFAVPANLGPRTMDYAALFNGGIYALASGISVFAGVVDDPFWSDQGGLGDTLNFGLAPPVLSPAQDAALVNLASDTASGFGVKAIALDVPVSMLTRTGAVEAASSVAATIGVWATTSRPRSKVQASVPGGAPVLSTNFTQIQRMANPYVNALLIPIGSKDRFSQSLPKDDAQFASALLDPKLARILNALFAGAIAIPAPPRTDLLPLLQYVPPIAAAGSPAGPVADVLRLNTGVAPTLPSAPAASRLGLLGGDPAGFPNGRRLFDDVTDVMLRITAGVLDPSFNVFPNNALGDGVNVNDVPFRETFPFLGNAPSGRDRRHIDPGEPGCTGGAGAPCLP